VIYSDHTAGPSKCEASWIWIESLDSIFRSRRCSPSLEVHRERNISASTILAYLRPVSSVLSCFISFLLQNLFSFFSYLSFWIVVNLSIILIYINSIQLISHLSLRCRLGSHSNPCGAGGGLDSAPDWLREQLPPLDLTQQKHRRRFEDMTLWWTK
jgi:hypothetical protein